MAMMFGGRSTSAEMNVTPLIDVLLVLLIINMILLPHSLGEKVLIPQQSNETTPPPPEKDVIIQLHQTGEGRRPLLKIEDRDVSWDDLEAKVREVYSTRMDKVAFIKGDPEIDFHYVADVVDVTHHAGISQIGLLGARD
jgi:biopolymer transport protein TolR